MAASSTSVDLSRLPPPGFIEQLTLDQIRDDMIAAVQERLPSFDAAVPADPAVVVLDVAAYRELLLRRAVEDAARQLLVAYATGSRLDHLGALVGTARLMVAPADMITGAPAVYESDDAYRQRIVLAPEGFSVAGPELAYVAHAKGASGDVLDASATSPSPGRVLVSVLSRAGDGTAPAGLLDLVRAAVTAPRVRPLGDLVTVASAQVVPFGIEAGLVTYAGPDVAVVLAAAREALDIYLAESRLLGRDVTRAGMIAALKVPGVHNVALASPADDVACSAVQAAWCTGISLTHAGYAE